MGLQRYYADPACPFHWSNGAIGYRTGTMMSPVGPYAKVVDCPVAGTTLKRTCYATGPADTYFSVPATCKIKGKAVKGYFTSDDDGMVIFRPMVNELTRVGVPSEYLK